MWRIARSGNSNLKAKIHNYVQIQNKYVAEAMLAIYSNRKNMVQPLNKYCPKKGDKKLEIVIAILKIQFIKVQ